MNGSLRRASISSVSICIVGLAMGARAESGHDAWLRYERLATPPPLPAVLVTAAPESPVIASAREELIRGVRGMTGRNLRIAASRPPEPAIVLAMNAGLGTDAFSIRTGAGS